MSSFREYLVDYSASEREALTRFGRDLIEDPSHAGHYPTDDRLPGVKWPVATSTQNVWGVIPFHGSTLAGVVPRDTRADFDKWNSHVGINSRNIGQVIDFCKDTRRLFFCLRTDPIHYSNLDFLEPLFYELRPPLVATRPVETWGPDSEIRKWWKRFDQCAQGEFVGAIENVSRITGITNPAYISSRVDHYRSDYLVFRLFGYNDWADALEGLMITQPEMAMSAFADLGNAIAVPYTLPFSSLPILGSEELAALKSTRTSLTAGPVHQIEEQSPPLEVGTYLLRKKVLYPQSIDGCYDVIQRYDAVDLDRVRDAMSRALRDRAPDALDSSAQELGAACDRVWQDVDSVGRRDRVGEGLVGSSPTIAFAAIGALVGGPIGAGVGLLSGAAVSLLDKMVGDRLGRVGRSVFRRLSESPYLAEIYDFKVAKLNQSSPTAPRS